MREVGRSYMQLMYQVSNVNNSFLEKQQFYIRKTATLKFQLMQNFTIMENKLRKLHNSSQEIKVKFAFFSGTGDNQGCLTR